MSTLPPIQYSYFSQDVFGVEAPATLQQPDWLQDKTFVAALCDSWKSQYADYIGTIEAQTLVNRLIDSGEILAHDRSGTLVAVVENKYAGIASIRQLEGLALVTQLEVLEEYRGLGIGRQLVTALSTNKSPLMAHVSIHRPAIKSFYESLDFKVLQQVTVDHYEHALLFDVMARPVGGHQFFE